MSIRSHIVLGCFCAPIAESIFHIYKDENSYTLTIHTWSIPLRVEQGGGVMIENLKFNAPPPSLTGSWVSPAYLPVSSADTMVPWAARGTPWPCSLARSPCCSSSRSRPRSSERRASSRKCSRKCTRTLEFPSLRTGGERPVEGELPSPEPPSPGCPPRSRRPAHR